ncbi:MAG: ABC transporter substrate-binding protein, partial [Dehalococcoidia bacterium]|nr:ABC transporter substrate-binding protein [Dehalococcoidia bacterium]
GVGRTQEPNVEQIVALKPDIILFWGGYGAQQADEIQQRTGVPVIALHTYTTIEGMEKSYRLMGKVLGLESRAEELLAYARGKIDRISQRTSKITERPRVHLLFWFFWNGVSRIPIFYDPVDIAGGVNIARGMDPNVYGYSVKVPVEQVVAWQPDFVFIHGYPAKPNVSVETVLNDPRMKETSAVKNRRVYYTLGMSSGWHYDRVLTETTYMAKLMHPGLFKDIDAKKEGDEIFQKFYGVPGLWTDYGNFEGWINYYARLGL